MFFFFETFDDNKQTKWPIKSKTIRQYRKFCWKIVFWLVHPTLHSYSVFNSFVFLLVKYKQQANFQFKIFFRNGRNFFQNIHIDCVDEAPPVFSFPLFSRFLLKKTGIIQVVIMGKKTNRPLLQFSKRHIHSAFIFFS